MSFGEFLVKLDRRGVIRLGDKLYLSLMFKQVFGRKMNWKEPKTFNEKLQWLKIHDRNPEYSKLVDKYEVKKYIAEKIGEEYVIPTIGVYDNFDEIDFGKLPERFVLKTTHDSGGVVICRDKKELDVEVARGKIERSLKQKFYKISREWPYKNVEPRIIAEDFIEDEKDLKDYKFFVFNGEVRCFKVDFDRFVKHRANYYDRNAKLLKFGEEAYPPDFEKKIKMPEKLDKMIEIAEKLAGGKRFVRVDFYDIRGKIYFGEITFYPAGGFGKLVPEEWNGRLGGYLDLENLR